MSGQATGRNSGLAALLLLGVIWGATFPIARVGVDAGADPFLLVAVDFLLAAAVMAPVAVLTRTHLPPARRLAQSAGLGALLIAGINLPLYWGLRFTTGGTASIVYATSPIISLLVLLLLGTSVELHRRQAAALALGLGGVVLLGLATTGSSLLAGLSALVAFAIGATCQGTGAVLVGRARPAGEDHWGLTFQFLGGATAAFVALPFLSRSPAFPLTAVTLGSVAYVGILSMAAGYTLFFDLIHRAGAVRANQVTFLNPVVAVVAGVLLFGERFEALEAVALGLIIVALVLMHPRPKTPRVDAPAPGVPLAEARGEI